jgi:hypothetical protein
MLVNAEAHPGPALWQGLMLLSLWLPIGSMLWKDGKYTKHGLAAYFVEGVVLFLLIAT